MNPGTAVPNFAALKLCLDETRDAVQSVIERYAGGSQ
jgi:hypothetical protein